MNEGSTSLERHEGALVDGLIDWLQQVSYIAVLVSRLLI